MSTPDWIAVDWGTSNLRAWAMVDGRAVDERTSPTGTAGLDRDDFEPTLLGLVSPWLAPDRRSTVVACGMVGSRQGWIEAPYAAVPCPPRRSAAAFARPAVRDPRLTVHVLHGLSQQTPADVMRGEETQLAGLIAREPGFDGAACLPGTHSKWAQVRDGAVVSFATYMTGELFALLAGASVLRHSVSTEEWSDVEFAEAAADALARPEQVVARLFGIRAEALIAGLPPGRGRARLSGLLIGAELAAARGDWSGRDVVLIGASRLAGAYRAALALGGVDARALDAAEMTLAGLTAARAQLSKETAAT